MEEKNQSNSHGSPMVIDVMNCGNIPRYLRKIIIDHNLSYRVYKVEKSEGYLVFRFEATHFLTRYLIIHLITKEDG